MTRLTLQLTDDQIEELKYQIPATEVDEWRCNPEAVIRHLQTAFRSVTYLEAETLAYLLNLISNSRNINGTLVSYTMADLDRVKRVVSAVLDE